MGTNKNIGLDTVGGKIKYSIELLSFILLTSSVILSFIVFYNVIGDVCVNFKDTTFITKELVLCGR
ncbi:MAG: hypothetical protein DRP93_01225 [Candidatus Neomarinimicrobiota bacterium]|nr:MAG: hypothetical protein DRP93_01225 [Candidatus Neomarinimicrobiota bacterium]